MKTLLEDTLPDILQKALKGHVVDEHLSPNSKTLRQLQSLIDQGSEVSKDSLRFIANTLNLDFDALTRIQDDPSAEEPVLPEGCLKVESPFRSWSVNAYLLQIPDTHHCLIFDTCERPDELLALLEKTRFLPLAIYITHGHPDHIGGIQALQRRYPDLLVFASKPTPIPGALAIDFNKTVSWGPTTLLPLATPGHSDDGTTYLLQGWDKPLLIAGDAIFARSVGNIRSRYFQSLAIIRDSILSQPDEMLILPGHGPVTQVGTERVHNPFFAGKSEDPQNQPQREPELKESCPDSAPSSK